MGLGAVWSSTLPVWRANGVARLSKTVAENTATNTSARVSPLRECHLQSMPPAESPSESMRIENIPVNEDGHRQSSYSDSEGAHHHP